MTDFTTTPLENQFETQIVGEISSASTAPFDITVKKAISFTPASGGFYATLEPGTSKEEVMKISAVSGTTWTVSERGIATAKGGAATTTTHGGGSKIIISNNWSNFDDIATAIASKLDNTGETVTAFDLKVTGTDWRIREDSGDMKFTDDSQAEVSLATLAAAAGVDDKTKVSNADTTSDYLGDKIVATNGIKETITSPAGDEKLQLEIDTTTLPANLDEANTFFGATDITGAEAETLTDGSDASSKHYHKSGANNELLSQRRNWSLSRCTDTATGGTATESDYAYYILTQAANNALGIIQLKTYLASGNFVSVHDKNPAFHASCFYDAATAQEGFIGYVDEGVAGTSLENSVMTLDHFGFVIEDGTLYISCADGSTQTKIDISGTIADIATPHDYCATFDGTTATFYVDGASVGTIATHVPNGDLDSFSALVIADATGAAKVIRMLKEGWVSYDL